jgi:hypothetical protein
MLIADAQDALAAEIAARSKVWKALVYCEERERTMGTAPDRTLWGLYKYMPEPFRSAVVHQKMFGPIALLRPDSGQIEGVPQGWNFGTPEAPNIRWHYDTWPKEWKEYWNERNPTPQADFLYSQAKVTAYIGGNGVAKTTSLVAVLVAATLGCRPWLTRDDDRFYVRKVSGEILKPPVTVLYVTDDFKKIQDNLYDQKLFRPGGWPATPPDPTRESVKISQQLLRYDPNNKPSPVDQATKRNTQGYPAKLQWDNHSLWVFASYSQAKEALEGPEYDVVGFDEPPTSRTFDGAFRGTRESGGPIYLALTPLSEPWIQNTIIDAARSDSSIEVITSDGFANYKNQDPGWIYQFMDKMHPAKIRARIFARYGVTAGSEFPEWTTRPEDGYYIDYEPFPRDWPMVFGIDPHPEKDARATWAVVTPANAIIVVATALLKGAGTEELIQEIQEREAKYPWKNRVVLRIMDPHLAAMHGRLQSGDPDSYLEVFESKSPIHWQWEIPAIKGPGSISKGHALMHDLMKPAYNRIRERELPRFQVVRTYDEAQLGDALIKYGWKAKEADGKDEIAVEAVLRDDQYKDIVDAIRYPIVYGLVFEELQAIATSIRNRGAVLPKAMAKTGW